MQSITQYPVLVPIFNKQNKSDFLKFNQLQIFHTYYTFLTSLARLICALFRM
jgi:hypothetical protein